MYVAFGVLMALSANNLPEDRPIIAPMVQMKIVKIKSRRPFGRDVRLIQAPLLGSVEKPKLGIADPITLPPVPKASFKETPAGSTKND